MEGIHTSISHDLEIGDWNSVQESEIQQQLSTIPDNLRRLFIKSLILEEGWEFFINPWGIPYPASKIRNLARLAQMSHIDLDEMLNHDSTDLSLIFSEEMYGIEYDIDNPHFKDAYYNRFLPRLIKEVARIPLRSQQSRSRPFSFGRGKRSSAGRKRRSHASQF